jgi:hypothetical protein
MPVHELYSQRRRRELGETEDVLQYALLSPAFRNQATYIVSDVYGPFDDINFDNSYVGFVNALRREFGVQRLTNTRHFRPGSELRDFILKASDQEALDAIEFMIRRIYLKTQRNSVIERERLQAESAVAEFNERCRQAALGYAFENGELIRIDSQFLHSEAAKPALIVLSDTRFQNADKEFRSAHEHWRHGNNSDVLVSCLKAFESTMKVIASDKGWVVPDKATAKQLVEVMFANKLIPAFYQTQLAGLRSMLESGIPTARNRAGGHGAGTATEAPAPDELVKYVLHLTAATILYLVDAYKALP